MSDESLTENELLNMVRAAVDDRLDTELIEVREVLSDEVRIAVREGGRDQPAVYRVVLQPDLDGAEDHFRWIYLGDSS